MPHCSPFINSISPPFLPSPFCPKSKVLYDNPSTNEKQFKPSNCSSVCISCNSPSFQREAMCYYSFMVLSVKFWRTSYRNQSSLCTSFEGARYSYKDWVLICLLYMNGSSYFFSFVCFFYKCLISPISRSQSRFQVGG